MASTTSSRVACHCRTRRRLRLTSALCTRLGLFDVFRLLFGSLARLSTELEDEDLAAETDSRVSFRSVMESWPDVFAVSARIRKATCIKIHNAVVHPVCLVWRRRFPVLRSNFARSRLAEGPSYRSHPHEGLSVHASPRGYTSDDRTSRCPNLIGQQL